MVWCVSAVSKPPRMISRTSVLVVAVRILEEHEIRRLPEEHPVLVELEAGGVVQVAGKDRALVRLAVPVGVLEDQQLVVHRRLRLPVRVVLPGRDPEPAARVERHLDRIDDLRELFLRREQLDLDALAERHLLDRFLAVQEDVLPLRPLAGKVRLRVDRRRRLVVYFEIGPARDSPDAPIAMGGHRVEDRGLALQHFVVGRQDVLFAGLPGDLLVDVARVVADEGQERPVAVRGKAVGHAVAVEPHRALVDDGLAQLRQVLRGRRQRRRGPDR